MDSPEQLEDNWGMEFVARKGLALDVPLTLELCSWAKGNHGAIFSTALLTLPYIPVEDARTKIAPTMLEIRRMVTMITTGDGCSADIHPEADSRQKN